MGAYDGAVNDAVFGFRVIGQTVMQRGPDAPGRRPAQHLQIEFQLPYSAGETPRRAGAGDPEYAGSETAAVGFLARIEVGAAAEEGEDFAPLAGCQFQICQAVVIAPNGNTA